MTAIPYVVGTVGMVLVGPAVGRQAGAQVATRLMALLVAAAGHRGRDAGAGDPVLKMVAFSVAGFGVFACLPVIWTLPTAYLSGAAAAGGIALVNSVGNLSGFFGPFAMGYIKDATGSFDGGLWVLAALGFIAMVIVLLFRHDPKLEEAPAVAEGFAD